MGISGGNVSIDVHLTRECDQKEEGCRLFCQGFFMSGEMGTVCQR